MEARLATKESGFLYALLEAIPRPGSPASQFTENDARLAGGFGELKEALSKVKQLSGLLPICMNCKKIRDDQGYWNQLQKCWRFS
jgi:hypothetical protein